MTTRFVEPIMQALDDTGTAIQGSRLFFYVQGTTTFLDTFQDEEETLPNANPVESVAGGRFPNIWLQEENYTVRFTIPVNGVDTDIWTVDITGISIPIASEAAFGTTRYATPAEMQAGAVTDRTATVQRITQDIVLDTARIQTGTFNAARLPTATTITQGAVIAADSADITAGTADRFVDASQLKAAIDSIVVGGIIIRIVANDVETGQTPEGTNTWIGDEATSPFRPTGGILSDVHVTGNGGENRNDQNRYALIEYSTNGGDTFTTAVDA